MSYGSAFFNNSGPKAEHLTRSGSSAEVRDLRKDVSSEFSRLAALAVAEFTNPAAAASNSLKTATATVAAVVVLTPADFVGSGELAFARPVTFTTAGGTPAHAPATAALEGLDVDGKFISETVNVGQTATTVSSTKCYKKLLKVTYAAADGTDATVAIGHGAGLGLARAPKSRAGLIRPLFENQDGAAVSPASGTLSAAATNPPYGMYTPADPADGTSDYAVFYEADQSVTNA